MWFLRFGLPLCKIIFMILSLSIGLPTGLANTNFNASIRDYSAHHINTTSQVRTLQKDGVITPLHYGGFIPTQYKEVPDNAISSSSHSRGLLHHEHGGYGLQDYDEGASQFDHGGGYNHRDNGLYDHGYSSHFGHGHGHSGPHVGFGYGGHHHKHHDHGLSAKFLIPVAGLALLGAAAALVSNPVLLQLGVVSGRRKRDTSEVISGPDLDLDLLRHWQSYPDRKDHIVRRLTQVPILFDHNAKGNSGYQVGGGAPKATKMEDLNRHGSTKSAVYRRDLNGQYKGVANKRLWLKRLPFKQSSVEAVTLYAQTQDGIVDDGFVPVALKLKKNLKIN